MAAAWKQGCNWEAVILAAVELLPHYTAEEVSAPAAQGAALWGHSE